MEIVYERCAGLDVHKKNVKACFTGPGQNGRRTKETRTYLTMTEDLLQVCDWLKGQGCTPYCPRGNRGVLEANL